MPLREEVFFRCGSIVLEGILEIPEGLTNGFPGAVVCHPHPLYGGNMHNNVVRALRKCFLDRGMACLRFNFRGTGRSEGGHGNGIAEMEDVAAAMDFLETRNQATGGQTVVAGYSFGCWVGLRAAAHDPRPSRLVGISPPVDSYDFGFLREETRPKLLIAGDSDFVCSGKRFEELISSIPDPKMTVLMRAADHFHVGREDELIRETNAFLDRYPFEVTTFS